MNWEEIEDHISDRWSYVGSYRALNQYTVGIRYLKGNIPISSAQ